jgi:hypothetical protein
MTAFSKHDFRSAIDGVAIVQGQLGKLPFGLSGFLPGHGHRTISGIRVPPSYSDPLPELAGKGFGIWFNEATPMGILKSAINALAGRKIDDIREALEFLPTTVGWTINTQTKTNEKGYTNHRILGVVTKAPEAPKASQMSTKD